MKIAIILAMGKELQMMLPLVSDLKETVSPFGNKIYTGRIGRAEVALMQCGIGKVNAALGTAQIIDLFHPDLVVNTGVAGGTGETEVLDVVVADRVAYHDVWCGPGTEWGDAAGCPRFFESDPRICGLDCLAERPGIHHGLLVSGDIFVSRPEEVDHIRGLYPDALAVDMESAAIAQTCYLRGVPFFVLRVVSDTLGAGEDNVAQYNNFWEEAPRHTFDLVKELLTEIPEN